MRLLAAFWDAIFYQNVLGKHARTSACFNYNCIEVSVTRTEKTYLKILSLSAAHNAH